MASVHDEYAKCEKCQKSGGVRYYNCNTHESSFECPFCYWFYEYEVFRFGRNHFDKLRRITKGEPGESRWRDVDCVLKQLLAACDENGQTERAEAVRTMLSRAPDDRDLRDWREVRKFAEHRALFRLVDGVVEMCLTDGYRRRVQPPEDPVSVGGGAERENWASGTGDINW